MGQCGLTVQEVEGKVEVEIGYLFLRKFWGRGLAPEAARDPAEKTGLTLEKEVWKSNKNIRVYAISKDENAP